MCFLQLLIFFEPNYASLTKTRSLLSVGDLAAEPTKYPSHFINQNAENQPSSVTIVQTITDGDPIKGTFLGPINIQKVVLSETGSAVAIVESSRLPVDAIARVLLPFLLTVACLANLLLLKSSYKLSQRRLPVAIYFVYLSLFDQLDLITRGTDYLVEAYCGIRLFTAILFLGRTACQLLPMLYSAMRHIHSSLLIGLSIDACRLAAYPEWFSYRYRREWTLNVLILSSVLAIILDCQFLWTFDLSLLETKLLHERVVHNAYECGFSQTSTLSPLFLHYIWPIIDHLWGEILPCVTGVAMGISVLILAERRQKFRAFRISLSNPMQTDTLGVRQKESRSERTEQRSSGCPTYSILEQSSRACALICITNGAFILPRLTFYLTKYDLFWSSQSNRGGAYWSHYDIAPEHPTLQAIADVQKRVSDWRKYEAPLEGVETILRYLGPINMIVNTIIFTRYITENRLKCGAYLSFVLSFLHRARGLSRITRFVGDQRHRILNERSKTTVRNCETIRQGHSDIVFIDKNNSLGETENEVRNSHMFQNSLTCRNGTSNSKRPRQSPIGRGPNFYASNTRVI